MPPRHPGRPKLNADDVSVKVSVTLTSRQYDAVWQQAQRERVTVSEAVRRLLYQRMRQWQDDDDGG